MKNSTQIIAQHKNESMSETMKKNSREYKLLKEKVIELGEERDQMKPMQFKMLHESFARF